MQARVEMYHGEPTVFIPGTEANLKNLTMIATVYFPRISHDDLYFEEHGRASADEVALRRFPKNNLPTKSGTTCDIPILSRPTLGRALKAYGEAGSSYPLELARVRWDGLYGQYRLTLECSAVKEKEQEA